MNKAASLEEFIRIGNFDLACLIEIWMDDDEVVALVQMTFPGYAALHQLQQEDGKW